WGIAPRSAVSPASAIDRAWGDSPASTIGRASATARVSITGRASGIARASTIGRASATALASTIALEAVNSSIDLLTRVLGLARPHTTAGAVHTGATTRDGPAVTGMATTTTATGDGVPLPWEPRPG